MAKRDQAVGLASAIRSVETEYRCRLTTGAAESAADIRQQIFKTPCWVGVGEESLWIKIVGGALPDDHLRQIRCEIRLRNLTREYIRTRMAGIENGRSSHLLFIKNSAVVWMQMPCVIAELFMNRPKSRKSPVKMWVALQLSAA